jgi:hypothetical protein
LDIRHIRLVGFNLNDREQWQTEITHGPEQPIQRGLINDGADQKGVAVVFQRNGKTPKPVCPFPAYVTLQPDLIDHALT